MKLRYSNGILGLYSARENLFLVVVYRQPDDSSGGNCSSINEFKPALDKIQAEITEIGEPSPNILICGDFNLPGISWDNVARRAGSDSIASSLIDFMEKHFLNQYILQSTHKDGDSLDLVFTNNANLLHSYECIIPTLSSVFEHYIALDPLLLKTYVASRLIPLNKNPGVRPIGVGEVLRHIVGKASELMRKLLFTLCDKFLNVMLLMQCFSLTPKMRSII